MAREAGEGEGSSWTCRVILDSFTSLVTARLAAFHVVFDMMRSEMARRYLGKWSGRVNPTTKSGT